jgi:hypothetical protein
MRRAIEDSKPPMPATNPNYPDLPDEVKEFYACLAEDRQTTEPVFPIRIPHAALDGNALIAAGFLFALGSLALRIWQGWRPWILFPFGLFWMGMGVWNLRQCTTFYATHFDVR